MRNKIKGNIRAMIIKGLSLFVAGIFFINQLAFALPDISTLRPQSATGAPAAKLDLARDISARTVKSSSSGDLNKLLSIDLNSATTEELASVVRELVKQGVLEQIPKLQQKFMIYSAAPGTGKGELMEATFEGKGKYADLIGKLILYHTRDPRVKNGQCEKDGVKYHFRTQKQLEELANQGKIKLAWVNRQLQGVATDNFAEENVVIEGAIGASNLQAGDVITSIEADVITVERKGEKISLVPEAVTIPESIKGILLVGDKIREAKGGTVIVDRPILGMSSVFDGAKPVILEGGYGWFQSLSSSYADIMTTFIAPFSSIEIARRARNSRWITDEFGSPEDRLFAYRAVAALIQKYQHELDISAATEEGERVRDEIRKAVEAEHIVIYNARLIESAAFLEDLNHLLKSFNKPTITSKPNIFIARAMAYEVVRRIESREGYVRFGRGKRPEYAEGETDPQFDRYNRVLEGVAQILNRNDYTKGRKAGAVIYNPWGYTKEAKAAIIARLTDEFTRPFFVNIIKGVRGEIKSFCPITAGLTNITRQQLEGTFIDSLEVRLDLSKPKAQRFRFVGAESFKTVQQRLKEFVTEKVVGFLESASRERIELDNNDDDPGDYSVDCYRLEKCNMSEGAAIGALLAIFDREAFNETLTLINEILDAGWYSGSYDFRRGMQPEITKIQQSKRYPDNSLSAFQELKARLGKEQFKMKPDFRGDSIDFSFYVKFLLEEVEKRNILSDDEYALFLDLGNVIVNFDMDKVVDKLLPFCTGKSREEILEVIKKPETYYRFEKAEISPEEFYEEMQNKLGFSKKLDIDNFKFIFTDIFTPIPEMIQLIEQLLDKGVSVYVISNTNVWHLDFLIKNIELLRRIGKERIISSCNTGFRKPDIGIFKEALRISGVAPEKAVFVDDMEDNFAKAKKIGVSTYLFSKNNIGLFSSFVEELLGDKIQPFAPQTPAQPIRYSELKDSLAKLLNVSLDALEELVRDNDELNTYLQHILSKQENRAPPVAIKVSSALPINAARYYNEDTREVEIILNERFIRTLLGAYDTYDNVRYILAERLFRVLGHNNKTPHLYDYMRQEYELIKMDTRLYGLIRQKGIQHQIDAYIKAGNLEFPSVYYFRLLDTLLNDPSIIEDFDKAIAKVHRIEDAVRKVHKDKDRSGMGETTREPRNERIKNAFELADSPNAVIDKYVSMDKLSGTFLGMYAAILYQRAIVAGGESFIFLADPTKGVVHIPFEELKQPRVARKDNNGQPIESTRWARQYYAFHKGLTFAEGISITEAENGKGYQQKFHKHTTTEQTVSLCDHTEVVYAHARSEKDKDVPPEKQAEAIVDGKKIPLVIDGTRTAKFGEMIRMPQGFFHTLNNPNEEFPSRDFTTKEPLTRIIKDYAPNYVQTLGQLEIVGEEHADWKTKVYHKHDWGKEYVHDYGKYASRLLLENNGDMKYTLDDKGEPVPVMDSIIHLNLRLAAVEQGKTTGKIDYKPLNTGLPLYGNSQFIRILPWPKDITDKGWILDRERKNIRGVVRVFDKQDELIKETEVLGGDIVMLDNPDISHFTVKNTSTEKDYELTFFVLEPVKTEDIPDVAITLPPQAELVNALQLTLLTDKTTAKASSAGDIYVRAEDSLKALLKVIPDSKRFLVEYGINLLNSNDKKLQWTGLVLAARFTEDKTLRENVISKAEELLNEIEGAQSEYGVRLRLILELLPQIIDKRPAFEFINRRFDKEHYYGSKGRMAAAMVTLTDELSIDDKGALQYLASELRQTGSNKWRRSDVIQHLKRMGRKSYLRALYGDYSLLEPERLHLDLENNSREEYIKYGRYDGDESIRVDDTGSIYRIGGIYGLTELTLEGRFDVHELVAILLHRAEAAERFEDSKAALECLGDLAKEGKAADADIPDIASSMICILKSEDYKHYIIKGEASRVLGILSDRISSDLREEAKEALLGAAMKKSELNVEAAKALAEFGDNKGEDFLRGSLLLLKPPMEGITIVSLGAPSPVKAARALYELKVQSRLQYNAALEAIDISEFDNLHEAAAAKAVKAFYAPRVEDAVHEMIQAARAMQTRPQYHEVQGELNAVVASAAIKEFNRGAWARGIPETKSSSAGRSADLRHALIDPSITTRQQIDSILSSAAFSGFGSSSVQVQAYPELAGTFADNLELTINIDKKGLDKAKPTRPSDPRTDALAELFNRAMGLLEEITGIDPELKVYYDSLLTARYNKSSPNNKPQNIIRFSEKLKRDAARYFNKNANRIELIFNIEFIELLLKELESPVADESKLQRDRAVYAILAQRIFHELGHTNLRIGQYEQVREEYERVVQDLRLYQLIKEIGIDDCIKAYYTDVFPSGTSYLSRIFRTLADTNESLRNPESLLYKAVKKILVEMQAVERLEQNIDDVGNRVEVFLEDFKSQNKNLYESFSEAEKITFKNILIWLRDHLIHYEGGYLRTIIKLDELVKRQPDILYRFEKIIDDLENLEREAIRDYMRYRSSVHSSYDSAYDNTLRERVKERAGHVRSNIVPYLKDDSPNRIELPSARPYTFLRDYISQLSIRASILSSENLFYLVTNQQVTVIPWDHINLVDYTGSDGDGTIRQYISLATNWSQALGFAMTRAQNKEGGRQRPHTHPNVERTLSLSDDTWVVNYAKIMDEVLKRLIQQGKFQELKGGYSSLYSITIKALLLDIIEHLQHRKAVDLIRETTSDKPSKSDVKNFREMINMYRQLSPQEQERFADILTYIEQYISPKLQELEESAQFGFRLLFGHISYIPPDVSHYIKNINPNIPSADCTIKDMFLQLYRITGKPGALANIESLPPQSESSHPWGDVFSQVLTDMTSGVAMDHHGQLYFAYDEKGRYNPISTDKISLKQTILTVCPGKETSVFDLEDFGEPATDDVRIVMVKPWPKSIPKGWDVIKDHDQLQAKVSLYSSSRAKPVKTVLVQGGEQVVINNREFKEKITHISIKNVSKKDGEEAYKTIVVIIPGAESNNPLKCFGESSKASSAGINLSHLSDYDAQHYLADFLLNYTPTGIISVPNESQAVIVYSDSLKNSPALQDIIRQSAGDSRKFYLVNKEQGISTDEFLAGLNIDKAIFQRHVFYQNSMTADQLALTIAGMLHNNGIKQGRVFASTEEDLAAWSNQGLIEALVMLLKDKRFEIISDYSQQHMEYIKTHQQALIAA